MCSDSPSNGGSREITKAGDRTIAGFFFCCEVANDGEVVM